MFGAWWCRAHCTVCGIIMTRFVPCLVMQLIQRPECRPSVVHVKNPWKRMQKMCTSIFKSRKGMVVKSRRLGMAMCRASGNWKTRLNQDYLNQLATAVGLLSWKGLEYIWPKVGDEAATCSPECAQDWNLHHEGNVRGDTSMHQPCQVLLLQITAISDVNEF